MEILIGCVLGLGILLLWLGVFWGFSYLLTCGVQYVALELFQKDLPFWPTFLCWYIFMLIMRMAFGRSSSGSK